MSLELYHSWFSTCSQKVRIVLAEKQLSYKSSVIDLRKGENLTEEYLAINANGVVPSLKHNDLTVTDSSVICEYLDEVFPEHCLSPQDAYGRAQMRIWMRYFEEVPTAAIRIPSFSKLFAKEFESMNEDAFSQLTERKPLRKHFYQQMGTSGFSKEEVAQSQEKLRSCLVRVDNALLDGRDYLLGNSFTLADIVLIPSAIRMVDLQLGGLWQDLGFFAGWLQRIQDRPSFTKAYPEGSRFQLLE